MTEEVTYAVIEIHNPDRADVSVAMELPTPPIEQLNLNTSSISLYGCNPNDAVFILMIYRPVRQCGHKYDC